jgi:hypothetical protein
MQETKPKKSQKQKERQGTYGNRPVGPQGWRDEETMLKQREDAYRRHVLEKEPLRGIARDFGISVASVRFDVEQYTKMLRDELPRTFEAWQNRMWLEYDELKRQADDLYNEANPGSLVRAQAFKMKIELTEKIERLFGINKAVKAPMPGEEDADDEIVWK